MFFAIFTAKSTHLKRRRPFKILLKLLATLLLLVEGMLVVLHQPATQRRLTSRLEGWLSERLKTEVTIERIAFRFPKSLEINGVSVETPTGDSLLQLGSLLLEVDMWALFDRRVVVKKIGLENTNLQIRQANGASNVDFILQAFATTVDPAPAPPSDEPGFQVVFHPTAFRLKNVLLDWQDADNQQFIRSDIGLLELYLKTGDLGNLRFEAAELALSDTEIRFQDLAPPSPDTTSAPSFFEVLVEKTAIENSRLHFEASDLKLEADLAGAQLRRFALRSGDAGLGITAAVLELKNSAVALQQNAAQPTPGHFNPENFQWENLTAELAGFSYQNDSLDVAVKSLSGTESSGLAVKYLRGNLSLTPDKITVQNLDLQANALKVNADASLRLGGSGQPTLPFFEAKLRPSQGTVADLLRLLPPDPAFSELEKIARTDWSLAGSVSGNLENLTAENLAFRFGQYTLLACNGRLLHLADLGQLDGNLQVAAFHFEKSDFTPLLVGRHWPLPAFANLSGQVSGQAGKLQLHLAGSFGGLDTLATAAPQLDTANFDLSGDLSGLADPNKFRFDVDIRRLDMFGNQFSQFAPNDISLPDRLGIVGKMKGNSASLHADLRLEAQRGSARSGLNLVGNLRSLDKPDSLFFDLRFEGEVARAEVFGYVPDSLVSPFVRLPETIGLHGEAKGRTDELRSAVNINLGENGSFALYGTLRQEKYQAKVFGKQLKINQLAVDSLLPQFNLLDLELDLEGEGFAFGETAKLDLEGKLQRLDWDGLVLENIGLQGQLREKQAQLKLDSPDPRLNLSTTANLDFFDARPKLQSALTFHCVDFKALGLTDRDATASFHLQATALGASLDSLEASAALQQLEFQVDTAHVKLGDIAMTASLLDGKNRASLSSDWLNAAVDGQFDPAQLPALLQTIAQQYFKTGQTLLQPQQGHASFSLSFSHPGLVASGILPALNELDSLSLSGHFDAANHQFQLKTSLPKLGYGDWEVTGATLDGAGDGKTARFSIQVPGVRQFGEAFVNDLSLNAQLDGHRADAKLVALDSVGQERFGLGVFAETSDFSEGYALHFAPNQRINYADWAIPADNSLAWNGDLVSLKNLYFENGEQSLKLAGETKLRPNGSPSLDFSLRMNHLNLDNFEPFLTGVLADVEGWLDADLHLSGTADAPKPSGNFGLKQTKATVALTNVRYALADQSFDLAPTGVDLSGLKLMGPNGKSLIINGLLRTSDWLDFRYDLTLNSAAWQLLNKPKSKSAAYYGQLTAALDGSIRGPLAQPDITLTASPVRGSALYYVYDDAASQSDGNGLVVFTKTDPTIEEKRSVALTKYPFHLNLNLDITEELLLNVVTDPGSGDFFEGNLAGRLSLEIFPDGKMNLAGRTEVKTGIYRFTYEQLVKRIFQVAPGSYLAWTGDPFNPELGITARFAVRTSPVPLLEATQVANNPALRDYQTFFLNFLVSGDVQDTKLDIQLQYPDNEEIIEGNIANSDHDEISNAVETLNGDQAALSQQVFGLLIFQQFLGTTEGAAYASQNPLGKGLSNFLTAQFNQLAGQYLKFVDVKLEVSEDAYAGAGDQYVGATNYNLRLQKSFLNDRLVFKVSGVATEERGTSTELRSSLQNASVEYLLKPNGTLKIRAFTEDGFELFDSDVSRNSGAGIVFTKEFKRLRKR